MLTNDQILAIGRQFFKEKPDQRQETLDAYCDSVRAVIAAHYSTEPIPMVLYCPNCGMQHIDGVETLDTDWGNTITESVTWDNPPHRSHLCANCSHVWRPADVSTTGVKAIETRGQNDSPVPSLPGAGALGAQAVRLLRTLVALLDSTQYCNSPSVKVALKFLGEGNNENASRTKPV